MKKMGLGYNLSPILKMKENRMNLFMSLKEYLLDIKKNYGEKRIVIYGILFSMVIYWVDLKDIPSQTMKNFGLKSCVFFGVCIIIIFLTCIKKEKKQEMEKVNRVYWYDGIITSFLCGSVVYMLGAFVTFFKLYKLVLGIVIIGIVFLLMVKRALTINENRVLSVINRDNIVDLKILCDDESELPNNIVFLAEEEVDYDLLNRKSIIDYIYTILRECNPRKSFVISVEGGWGSGKTTILKNVKQRLEDDENIIVIDEFNPWEYGSELAIVEEFFLHIKNNCKMNTNMFEINKAIRGLIQAVVSTNDDKMLGKLFSEWMDDKRAVEDNRKIINEELMLIDKKIIIYLDNLDRLDKEKLVFLIDLVSSVLNFNRIIYVLAFDGERVKKILEDELDIDYEYLEKIIQLEVNIPQISRVQLENIAKKAVAKSVRKYCPNEENVYLKFIHLILPHIKNLRQFKRIYNSVIIKSLMQNNNLSRLDSLILEYIKLYNYSLYLDIYINKENYILLDNLSDKEKDDLNDKAKDYFDKTFANEKNGLYLEILAEIFPNVKNYTNQWSIFNKVIDNNMMNRIQQTRAIAGKNYFGLYYTETENI